MDDSYSPKDKVLSELSSRKDIINWKIQSKQWRSRKKKEGDFANKLMNYVYLRNENYCWQCQTNEDSLESSVLETRQYLQANEDKLPIPTIQERVPCTEEQQRAPRPKVPYKRTSDISHENVQNPFQMFDYPVPEELVHFLADASPCEPGDPEKRKATPHASCQGAAASRCVARCPRPNISQKSKERFKELYRLMEKYKKNNDYTLNRCTQTELMQGLKSPTPVQEKEPPPPVKYPKKPPIAINKLSILDKKLRQLEDTALTTDISVYVCNKLFKAHRVILMAFSNYFNKILSSRTRLFNKLQVTDVSPEVFEVIHKWMYTYQFDLTIDNMCNVIKAAKCLEMPLLIKKFHRSIGKLIVEVGPLYMLHLCKDSTDDIVLKSIVHFISKFLPELAQSAPFLNYNATEVAVLLDNPYIGYSRRIHMFEATIRWLAHKWERRKYYTDKLLSHIHADMMADEDLFKCIRMTRDLSITQSAVCRDAILQHLLAFVDDPNRAVKAKEAYCRESKVKETFLSDLMSVDVGKELKDPCLLKEIVTIQSRLQDFKGLVKSLPVNYIHFPTSPVCEHSSVIAETRRRENEAAQKIQAWYRGSTLRQKLRKQATDNPNKWIPIPVVDADKYPNVAQTCLWKPATEDEDVPICRVTRVTDNEVIITCDGNVICKMPDKAEELSQDVSNKQEYKFVVAKQAEDDTFERKAYEVRPEGPHLEDFLSDEEAADQERELLDEIYKERSFEDLPEANLEFSTPESPQRRRVYKFQKLIRQFLPTNQTEEETENTAAAKKTKTAEDVATKDKRVCVTQPAVYLQPRGKKQGVVRQCVDEKLSKNKSKDEEMAMDKKESKPEETSHQEDDSKPYTVRSAAEKRRHNVCDYPAHPMFRELPTPKLLDEEIILEEEPEETCNSDPCLLIPRGDRPFSDVIDIMPSVDVDKLQELKFQGPCAVPVNPLYQHLPTAVLDDEEDVVVCEEEREPEDMRSITVPRGEPIADVRDIMNRLDVCTLSKTEIDAIFRRDPCNMLHPSYGELPITQHFKSEDDEIEGLFDDVCVRIPRHDEHDTDVLTMMRDPCIGYNEPEEVFIKTDPCRRYPKRRQLPIVPLHIIDKDEEIFDPDEAPCVSVPRKDCADTDVRLMMRKSDVPEWKLRSTPCPRRYPRRKALPLAAKPPCVKRDPLPKELRDEEPCSLIPIRDTLEKDVRGMLVSKLDVPHPEEPPLHPHTSPRQRELPVYMPRAKRDIFGTTADGSSVCIPGTSDGTGQARSIEESMTEENVKDAQLLSYRPFVHNELLRRHPVSKQLPVMVSERAKDDENDLPFLEDDLEEPILDCNVSNGVKSAKPSVCYPCRVVERYSKLQRAHLIESSETELETPERHPVVCDSCKTIDRSTEEHEDDGIEFSEADLMTKSDYQMLQETPKSRSSVREPNKTVKQHKKPQVTSSGSVFSDAKIPRTGPTPERPTSFCDPCKVVKQREAELIRPPETDLLKTSERPASVCGPCKIVKQHEAGLTRPSESDSSKTSEWPVSVCDPCKIVQDYYKKCEAGLPRPSESDLSKTSERSSSIRDPCKIVEEYYRQREVGLSRPSETVLLEDEERFKKISKHAEDRSDDEFDDSGEWEDSDVLDDAPWLLDAKSESRVRPRDSNASKLVLRERPKTNWKEKFSEFTLSQHRRKPFVRSEQLLDAGKTQMQSKALPIVGLETPSPLSTKQTVDGKPNSKLQLRPSESRAEKYKVPECVARQPRAEEQNEVTCSKQTRSTPITPVCKEIQRGEVTAKGAEVCKEVKQRSETSAPAAFDTTPFSQYSEQCITSRSVSQSTPSSCVCSEMQGVCDPGDMSEKDSCGTKRKSVESRVLKHIVPSCSDHQSATIVTTSCESDLCTKEKAELERSIALKSARCHIDSPCLTVEAPKPVGGNMFTTFMSKFIPKTVGKVPFLKYEDKEECHPPSDCITVIAGNKKFKLKRCVLCDVSNWISKNLCKTNEVVECISIPNIPGNVFELVSDWISSGELEVTLDNVSDVIHAAEFLEMPTFYAYICQSLADMIYCVGPLHMLCFAETSNDPLLLKEIIAIVSCNVKTISQNSSFHSYTPKELSTLLTQKALHFPSKTEVIEAIIRWLAYDWDKRNRYTVEMLCLGGLHGLSAEEIAECIKFTTNPSEAMLKACREKLLAILYYENASRRPPSNCEETRTNYTEDGETTPSDESSPPPSPRRSALLIIGGIDTCMTAQNYRDASRLGGAMLSYSPMENRWSSFEQLPSARHHSAAALLHGTVYITGGSSQFSDDFLDATNTVWCFDYLGNHGWSVKSPMHHARVYHSLININGLLYAVGGMGNAKHVLRSIECYDPAANKWTEVACLQYPRMAMATICFHKTLLICGGLGVDPANSRSVLLRTCEMFVPESKDVIRIRPLRIPRCFSSLTCFNHKLHLVGGATIGTQCDEPNLCSISDVDYWDEEAKQWIKWTSLKIPRQDLVTAVIGPRLYVVGGHNSEERHCILSVECYDLICEGWIQGIASLPISVSGSAGAVVENLNPRPVTIISTAAV